ncbi:MAG: hypothetical protein WD423_02295 [Rhodothermales bacterium]
MASLLLVLPLGSHAADAVLCIKGDGDAGAPVEGTVSSGVLLSDHLEEAHHFLPAVEKAGHESSHATDHTDIPMPPGADQDCASFKPDAQPDLTPVAVVVALLQLDESNVYRAWAQSGEADEHFQFLSLAPVRTTHLLI